MKKIALIACVVVIAFTTISQIIPPLHVPQEPATVDQPLADPPQPPIPPSPPAPPEGVDNELPAPPPPPEPPLSSDELKAPPPPPEPPTPPNPDF